MEEKFDAVFTIDYSEMCINTVVSKIAPRGRDIYRCKIITPHNVKGLQEKERWVFESGFKGSTTGPDYQRKYNAKIQKIKNGIIVTLKRKQHKILQTLKVPNGTNFILEMKMRLSVKENEDLANPKTNPELVFMTRYMTSQTPYGTITMSRRKCHLTLKDGKFYTSRGKLFTASNQDFFINAFNC
jgi:hypothetical protein